MLTFRKGGYSKEELQTLYNLMLGGFSNCRCDAQCSICENRKPCGDVARVMRYVKVQIENFEE